MMMQRGSNGDDDDDEDDEDDEDDDDDACRVGLQVCSTLHQWRTWNKKIALER